ncbi:hypothetical protein PABG_01450 [Paracoccidioides brasiliensis Pb03]|nr:hypothetical protein PABG_01450 [Paracoccidioides brasiliensis Pb03]
MPSRPKGSSPFSAVSVRNCLDILYVLIQMVLVVLVPRDSDLKFETFMELNNDLSNLVIWHFILAKNLCKVAAPPSSFPIIFNDGADDVTFVSKYSKGKTFRSVVERQSETILIGACRKLLLGVVLLQCDCRLSAPVA